MKDRPLRVVLSAPFTQWMDPDIGRVSEEWRQRLDFLRCRLIWHGALVFNAHHNEDWGVGWLPPAECTPADFVAVQEADVMCAIVGAPASGGVLMELGWASAFGKPVVLVLSPNVTYTPLIHGLGEVTDVESVPEPETWSTTELSDLAQQVVKMGERHQGKGEAEHVRR